MTTLRKDYPWIIDWLRGLGMGVLLFLLAPVFSLFASEDEGRLQRFQDGLRASPDESPPSPSDLEDSRSGFEAHRSTYARHEALADTSLSLLGNFFLFGTANSMALVASEPRADALVVSPRKAGDPVLPYIAGEFQYQWIDGNTDAVDFRLAGGYGPVGTSVRWTHYRENDPDNHLNVLQVYGHLRLTMGKFLEFSPGLGYANFSVSNGPGSEGGFALTLPLRVHFHPGIGLEYRPAWMSPNQTSVSDQDVALVLGRRHTFLRLGYRWIWNDAETLSGPYAGIALQW